MGVPPALTRSEGRRRVCVIGGGVGGCATAYELALRGMEVTLVEKSDGLLTGLPFEHIHAGGALYREIDDHQCFELLEECICFMRRFPMSVLHRPTVIALPITDGGRPEPILARFLSVQGRYAELCEEDHRNEVMGPPEDYFRSYTRGDMERLRSRPVAEIPAENRTPDDWMTTVAKLCDLDKLVFPLFLVQEYGWHQTNLAAFFELVLPLQCNVLTGVEVASVALSRADTGDVYTVSTDKTPDMQFSYLVNAAGFRTGIFDDQLALPKQRLVEYKAAYCAAWNPLLEGVQLKDLPLPEIVFHGPRGTPEGMAQFSPAGDGLFKLHGMTEEITLFPDSKAFSTAASSQPALPTAHLERIDHGWTRQEADERTNRSIRHVARLIPSFVGAVPGGAPFHGGQQIQGSDASRRCRRRSSGSVSGTYMRVEIVKANTAISAGRMAALMCGMEEPMGWEVDWEPHVSMEQIEARAEVCLRRRQLREGEEGYVDMRC